MRRQVPLFSQVAELYEELKNRMAQFNVHVGARRPVLDQEHTHKQRFILQVRRLPAACSFRGAGAGLCPERRGGRPGLPLGLVFSDRRGGSSGLWRRAPLCLGKAFGCSFLLLTTWFLNRGEKERDKSPMCRPFIRCLPQLRLGQGKARAKSCGSATWVSLMDSRVPGAASTWSLPGCTLTGSGVKPDSNPGSDTGCGHLGSNVRASPHTCLFDLLRKQKCWS